MPGVKKQNMRPTRHVLIEEDLLTIIDRQKGITRSQKLRNYIIDRNKTIDRYWHDNNTDRWNLIKAEWRLSHWYAKRLGLSSLSVALRRVPYWVEIKFN